MYSIDLNLNLILDLHNILNEIQEENSNKLIVKNKDSLKLKETTKEKEHSENNNKKKI